MTQPPDKAFIPGRWQPLHRGHVALIREVLAGGTDVVIGIFDTPDSERNPYDVAARVLMFNAAFGPEIAAGRVELLVMPWVRELLYGRNCGWSARRIHLPDEIEDGYSGTSIRERERKSHGRGTHSP